MRHNLKRGEESGFVFLADIKLRPREGEAGGYEDVLFISSRLENGKWEKIIVARLQVVFSASFDDPAREVGSGVERESNVGELGGRVRIQSGAGERRDKCVNGAVSPISLLAGIFFLPVLNALRAFELKMSSLRDRSRVVEIRKSRKFRLRVWPVEGLDNANLPFKNEICQVRMAHRAHLGIILDLLEAIETLQGALGHILIRSYFSTSTHPFCKFSTNGDDVENEFIEDRTPGFSLPSDFFRTPVGALKFEWFGEYPDTDEDVFHVQMPLPDGTEWKIRIFPSGRTNMSIFGYFLQPVGDDGIPRVPEGFKVRLALGGPPVESWEQRFKGCLNLNLLPVITNEKWYFKEGQKVAICKNEEAVGEITIPVNAERERERQRQRNNGRSVEVIRLEAVWVEAVWVEVVRVEVV
ncbi:hypothetical protein F5877DRAFT_69055 [Lentinula edodes]|nr:hypothetical protein F5877DRAFT_69055 [Lentinula edodes]